MFSLEYEVIRNNEQGKIGSVCYTDVSVTNVKLWKLMTTILSQLTCDVPVLNPTRSNCLLLLALPPGMTVENLVRFVQRTEPAKKFSITFIRHFMNSAIIEFESQADADKFYVRSLGIQFESVLSHVKCILLFIYSIQCPNCTILPMKTMKESGQVEFQLPMCPICFLLFDPLISSYFSTCLVGDISDEAFQQWGCPECQVCQKIHQPENRSKMFCTCGENNNLWICLYCGHVGCERDHNRHAIEHFQKTNHRFAFRIDRTWLWDYISDRSVDRTFQSITQAPAENITDNYREMLVDGICAVHQKCDADRESIDNGIGKKIIMRRNEVSELTDQINLLESQYKEALELQNQLTELMQRMNQIKSSKIMVEVGELEKLNAEYKDKLTKLNQKQEMLFQKLEQRSDVTNQVVIDM
ncbi:nuclear localization sequence binding [Trichomonas vaginalis G3]|nr:nuclear localization sequence binding [Trichomonas vaginalis G3]KAI5520426.1 nuclear localization sequence binding [Trichomonas vaginalis G3]